MYTKKENSASKMPGVPHFRRGSAAVFWEETLWEKKGKLGKRYRENIYNIFSKWRKANREVWKSLKITFKRFAGYSGVLFNSKSN